MWKKISTHKDWPWWQKIYYFVFPEIIMHNHMYRLRKFVESVPANLSPGDSLLDAGAGDMKYKSIFFGYKYTSQDITSEFGADIVCDISSIPLPDHTFDAIMSVQVLEHIKDPQSAFNELNRLLKPGGKLFLSTHLVFALHMEPYDYFRFTKYGLQHLAETAGFAVVSIKAQGGIFITISKLIQISIPQILPDSKIVLAVYYALFSVPIFFINLVLYLFDFLDKKKKVTLNYECIFEKIV